MKITVDTNVLISATFWFGDSNKIIQMVDDKQLELILSKPIIDEYKNVLFYNEIQSKIKNKNLEIIYSIKKLMSISKIIKPKEKINIIKEDSKDNKILECAIEGGVNLIISQDRHLLKLKNFRGIRIVTPKEFLNIFENVK